MQDPYIGSLLDGRYEILAKIGEGGMGVVYKARQVSIDRVIAIKVLNPQMAADQQWVQRFSNEARACSRLQHPNTIKMFDFGQTTDGRFFMTMEFLDGQVLRQAIQNSAPMAPARVMRILVQCCASLAEAHSIGIIHRDIKPDNVFLMNMPGSPDFVKLLDFSVAKLLAEGGGGMKTQAGVVFGTPQYMSPEQGRGMPLDARSDLYALGVLGYEMLTGNVPFNDENPMAVLQMHLRSEVPPLPGGLPPAVVNIVKKALDKDPGRRFQSAGEMMQTCQQVLTELNAGAAAAGAAAAAAAAGGAGGNAARTMMAQMPGGGLPGMPPPVGGGPPMQPGGGPPHGYPPPQAGAPHGYPPPQAGGQQKTMMAQMPPGGVPMGPPAAAAARPPGAYVQADHAQKTMIAGMSPFAAGGVMSSPGSGITPGGPGMSPGMPGMQPGMGGPQGMGMPGMQPPGMGGMGAPPGMQGMGGGMGQPGMQQQPGGGPPKTMMLQNTEGIVSVAARGAGAIPVSNPGPIVQMGPGPMVPVGQLVPPETTGATGAFWAISLMIGVAVGVLGYLVALQL